MVNSQLSYPFFEGLHHFKKFCLYISKGGTEKKTSAMISSPSMFTPALSGMAAGSLTAMNGIRIDRFSTPRTPKPGDYKPWDVKQEGGQMDSGWGSGEFVSIFLIYRSTEFPCNTLDF